MRPQKAEKEYLRRLKRLTNEERLNIGFELNELSLELLTLAVKKEYPKAKGGKILKLIQRRLFQ